MCPLPPFLFPCQVIAAHLSGVLPPPPRGAPQAPHWPWSLCAQGPEPPLPRLGPNFLVPLAGMCWPFFQLWSESGHAWMVSVNTGLPPTSPSTAKPGFLTCPTAASCFHISQPQVARTAGHLFVDLLGGGVCLPILVGPALVTA